jgi:hypothetical protein
MKAQQRVDVTNVANQRPELRTSNVTYSQESIMVVDCGSVTTKVVFLDVVEGQYRFIAYSEAPSTVGAPWNNVSTGIVDAVRTMEEVTGRVFLDEEGQLITPERSDASGVDLFLAVSSAAEPLRIILAGLVRDVSLASARRAALSTYTTIIDVISLERDPAEPRARTIDDQINAIWHQKPEAICMVGGTDDGASAPVVEMAQNVVRVALYLMEEQAPPVVYAGNARLRQTIAQQLGEITPLRTVDNVRPRPNVENIGPVHEEIEVLFYEHKMNELPGINVLRAWSPSVVLPTARSADYSIRYCERAWRTAKPALWVDIGGSSVTINACQRGQPLTIVRTDLGLGQGLLGVLEQVPMRDIVRWLPYEIGEREARDRLWNKALNPCTIPQTREDLLLEQAAAREMLRLALRDSLPGWPEPSDPFSAQMYQDWFNGNGLEMPVLPPCAPLIAGGSVFAHAPYHGHAALILLDALQPVGISELYVDEYNLIPSLGTVANANPLAVVQTLRGGGLTYLGMAVVPIGAAKPGEKVLTVRPADRQSSISSDIVYGTLEAIPFQFFQPGTKLELTPARGIDIGSGPGKSVEIEYKGGSVGLIVDARGRPLHLLEDPGAQRQHMDYWLWEMMSA